MSPDLKPSELVSLKSVIDLDSLCRDRLLLIWFEDISIKVNGTYFKRYMSTSSSGGSDGTVLALSAFSFGYSLRSIAGNDLNRHIQQIVVSNVDVKPRLV